MGTASSSLGLHAELRGVLDGDLIARLEHINVPQRCRAAKIEQVGALKTRVAAVLAEIQRTLDDKVQQHAQLPPRVEKMLRHQLDFESDRAEYMLAAKETTEYVIGIIPHVHLSREVKERVSSSFVRRTQTTYSSTVVLLAIAGLLSACCCDGAFIGRPLRCVRCLSLAA